MSRSEINQLPTMHFSRLVFPRALKEENSLNKIISSGRWKEEQRESSTAFLLAGQAEEKGARSSLDGDGDVGNKLAML